MSMPISSLKDIIKWDDKGLCPAIVQDYHTKEVLTLAYVNEESFLKSLETKETWFWSRSRAELWHKGATSGNTQQIVGFRYDCDADAILFEVICAGPACHTGETSCFHNIVMAHEGQQGVADGASAQNVSGVQGADARFAVLAELEQLIEERFKTRPEGAYTTYLFEKGLDKILKKVGEETAESIIAAKNNDNAELRYEVSDLIYHLLVLLRQQGLELDEIMQELQLRHERPRKD
ncbi:bifunctional phosphoribosyl-AMP cyclohydrolase/phosphoribosyl-ATP diphosphatase HisIE [Paenibacillus turicensis]|uniref:bifunctional phosphoribosyl-AMP cyclohydrolase/phosphoribosyl-ATP diphosphatase HisIE n=1 Tax=Paenibacillus turicensis TaxID=160487 RepID=UPI003D2C7683